VSSQRILIAFHCDRGLWFRWKNLCRPNGVTVEKASEALIAEKLSELGIQVQLPDDSGSMKRNPQLAKVQ